MLKVVYILYVWVVWPSHIHGTVTYIGSSIRDGVSGPGREGVQVEVGVSPSVNGQL